jgi:hypothetical protein
MGNGSNSVENLEIFTLPPLVDFLFFLWGLFLREVQVEVSKGTRWMPRRKAPMKDVAGCDKPRGAASEH